MKRIRLSVAFYVLLVFLSGAVVGGLAHRYYGLRAVRAAKAPTSPEEYRSRYVEEMRSRLKLREDQVLKLNEILDVTRNRYRELREKTKPELKAIQQHQVEMIRSILDDSQRAEYEKMRDEREKHRKQGQRHRR